MTLTIRPVTAADRPAWGTLWQAYLAFYETTLPAEIYDTSFARLLDPDTATFNGLIADLEGTPVGLTHYVYHPHMWKEARTCYLQDLYVAPEARGTGAGRALIQAVYDAADAAGADGVYWMTQEFNHNARLLYDRIGKLTPFVKYSRP